jgi:hypothetical protein
VIKHNFDQTPKLLQTFDQLIRSSEIRSSDQFPLIIIKAIELQCTLGLKELFGTCHL